MKEDFRKTLVGVSSAIFSIYLIYCASKFNLSSIKALKYKYPNGNMSHLIKPLSPEQQIQLLSKGAYNIHISNMNKSRNKLGFAVQPEFQIIPEYWQNVLRQWQLQSNNNNNSISFEDQKMSKNPPKKILIYHNTTWLGFEDCPKYVSLEFECEFLHWVTTQKGENGSETLQLKDLILKGELDAIFIHRDGSHGDRIQSELDLIYLDYKIKNDSISLKFPKLIYFSAEPPALPPNQFHFLAQPKFNDVEGSSRDFLASYWRGSDIYLPYFKWKYFDDSVTTRPQGRNYAKGRTKGAAILVSNCSPKNNRMGLVRELQKYIQVDVFGRCGPHKCDKTTCFEKIKKDYKFYLSFENSNCRDYITEKLQRNAFNNDLLPVVLGAHPSDYRAIAPENSYIHIEDFDSIEILGFYLQLLDKDDIMYNSYFAWKGTGKFVFRNLKCELCAFLHSEKKDVHTANFRLDFLENLDNETAILRPWSYFNRVDQYNFQTFNWSNSDPRLCLRDNQWYWNR